MDVLFTEGLLAVQYMGNFTTFAYEVILLAGLR